MWRLCLICDACVFAIKRRLDAAREAWRGRGDFDDRPGEDE